MTIRADRRSQSGVSTYLWFAVSSRPTGATCQPADAAFTTLEPQPRPFLFALTAIGIVYARLGRTDEARAALERVADLDPADCIRARRLPAVIERGDRDDA